MKWVWVDYGLQGVGTFQHYDTLCQGMFKVNEHTIPAWKIPVFGPFEIGRDDQNEIKMSGSITDHVYIFFCLETTPWYPKQENIAIFHTLSMK